MVNTFVCISNDRIGPCVIKERGSLLFVKLTA
jgi:hypothetical protein